MRAIKALHSAMNVIKSPIKLFFDRQSGTKKKDSIQQLRSKLNNTGIKQAMLQQSLNNTNIPKNDDSLSLRISFRKSITRAITESLLGENSEDYLFGIIGENQMLDDATFEQEISHLSKRISSIKPPRLSENDFNLCEGMDLSCITNTIKEVIDVINDPRDIVK